MSYLVRVLRFEEEPENPDDLYPLVRITDRHWSTQELIVRVTTDLARRIENVASPKDIDSLLDSEIAFIKLLRHKIDTASEDDKRIYAVLGLKIENIIIEHNAAKTAQAWIDWYKNKRIEDSAAIRNVEAHLPTCAEFQVLKTRFSLSRQTFIVRPNFAPPPEGTNYRVIQAQAYARALYNITCNSQPPAPGEPLWEDLYEPTRDEIPAPRSALGAWLFEGRTYAAFEAYILKFFLQTSINTGATSDLLPFVPVTNLSYLPANHPLNQ